MGLCTHCGMQWNQKIVAVKMQKRKSSEAGREIVFFQTIPSYNHLVTMLGHYVDEFNSYIVFEYMYGTLFETFRRATGVLPMDLSRRYAHQTLLGPRHIHSHDVAHRDISMSNILLHITSNSVKIADLGLAVKASTYARKGHRGIVVQSA